MKKKSSPPIKENFKCILFISGMSVKSLRAIENIKIIGNKYFSENFDLQIIDISAATNLASQYQIIAVPTLIRLEPLPLRTIIGDLSDTAKVLKILEIYE